MATLFEQFVNDNLPSTLRAVIPLSGNLPAGYILKTTGVGLNTEPVPDSVGYHQVVVGDDASTSDYRTIQEAVDYIVGLGQGVSKWTIFVNPPTLTTEYTLVRKISINLDQVGFLAIVANVQTISRTGVTIAGIANTIALRMDPTVDVPADTIDCMFEALMNGTASSGTRGLYLSGFSLSTTITNTSWPLYHSSEYSIFKYKKAASTDVCSFFLKDSTVFISNTDTLVPDKNIYFIRWDTTGTITGSAATHAIEACMLNFLMGSGLVSTGWFKLVDAPYDVVSYASWLRTYVTMSYLRAVQSSIRTIYDFSAPTTSENFACLLKDCTFTLSLSCDADSRIQFMDHRSASSVILDNTRFRLGGNGTSGINVLDLSKVILFHSDFASAIRSTGTIVDMISNTVNRDKLRYVDFANGTVTSYYDTLNDAKINNGSGLLTFLGSTTPNVFTAGNVKQVETESHGTARRVLGANIISQSPLAPAAPYTGDLWIQTTEQY